MTTDAGIETVILCGGRGTRLRELTESIPKVLVEVGGRPILWHIMKGYAEHDYRRFVLALGYLADRVAQYFVEGGGDAWDLRCVDTGLDTNTGGRIHRLQDQVHGDVFFATYGDGVSDVDHASLLDFHRSHGKVATLTAVRPFLNFGLLEVDADARVASFVEKPRLDHRINGGFFVFDRRVFDYLDDNAVLEREPMERLAADGQLMAYNHDGFWKCMDTYKDNVELNMEWESGRAPWKTWA